MTNPPTAIRWVGFCYCVKFQFVGLLHCTTKHVILSGARSAESKNLRIFDAF